MGFAALSLAAVYGAAALTDPLPAQDPPRPATGPSRERSGPPVDPDAIIDLGEVTVTGRRLRGSVRGDFEPLQTFDALQLKALGGASISEVMEALAPLTRSGGGPPVILVNGRRVSGMQEIAGIPSEAIERMEILPGEAALSYGYGADRVVMNFVLRTNFRQGAAQAATEIATAGGRTSEQVSGNFIAINPDGRWNVDGELNRSTPLYETERDVGRPEDALPYDLAGNVTGIPVGVEIDPALSALAGGAPTVAPVPSGLQDLAAFAATAGQSRTDGADAYRTLMPASRGGVVRGAISRYLGEATKRTLSFSLEDGSTTSYMGLAGVSLVVPAGQPGSPFGNDVWLHRYVADPAANRRDTDRRAAVLSGLVDGELGDWNYTLSGTFNRAETEVRTRRGFDPAGLQARLNQGDVPDPFGPIEIADLRPVSDQATSVSQDGGAELVLTGQSWEGPAGPLQTTVKLGINARSESSASRFDQSTTSDAFSAVRTSGEMSVFLPITRPDEHAGFGLGDLAASLSFGADYDTAFGTLSRLSASAHWAPAEFLGFSFSYASAEGAPPSGQMNAPALATPNVRVFDFATAETVEVTRISGGNPDLAAESRQTASLSVTLRPWRDRAFVVTTEAGWTGVENPLQAFPNVTPQLETILPDRFLRDSAGRLTTIDARPLNAVQSDKLEVRTGVNYMRPLGGDHTPASGDQPALRSRGSLILAVNHTWRVRDEVLVRRGMPALDQLSGASASGGGGVPRHELQFTGRLHQGGIGLGAKGAWRQGTRVDQANGGSIRFADFATMDVQMTVDLASRPGVARALPWLGAAELNLSVTNLFDARQSVTDEAGQPLAGYDPRQFDPLGRTVRLAFRKVF